MGLKSGYLKQYFKGVIAKKLSAVEADAMKSNQHEFNATTKMKEILGVERRKFLTDFIYITDDEEKSESSKDFLMWYDARENNPNRSEYKLYYPSNTVLKKAMVGDSLFICLKQDDTILCIVSGKDDNITSQLYWLFDIDDNKAERYAVNAELKTNGSHLEFAVRMILTQIGIEYEENDSDDLLAPLLKRFGSKFPKTDVFSEYARNLVHDVSPIEDPDRTLVKWFDMEEKLFFLLERNLIKERLKTGFIQDNDVDVDGFVKFSLSVQNRRKSRAGLSLENHICALLNANGIEYSHTPVTENRSKPDFLFPNIKCYRDEKFPSEHLTMLGSKSTCKDRWRQVLAEAERIDRKHLLTLEAAISTYQTDEMKDKKLQLVIPAEIHKTYTDAQQKWLYSVKDFLGEVSEKQKLTPYASMLLR